MAYKIQPNTIIRMQITEAARVRYGFKSNRVRMTFAQMAKVFGPDCARSASNIPFPRCADGVGVAPDFRVEIDGVEHKWSFKVIVPGTNDVRVFMVAFSEYYTNNRAEFDAHPVSHFR